MKEIYLSSRREWRRWLAANHEKEAQGIWLVFRKQHTGRPSLAYEEAVEEALRFGWIDSIIRRIDDVKYCRKFTPRKPDSSWSKANKQRVEKMTNEGRMTEFGVAKVEAAKKLGKWGIDARPVITTELPQDLSEAFGRDDKARDFFESLAPSYRKHFIGWIVTAKKAETRAKRLKECLVVLGKRQKLGLK